MVLRGRLRATLFCLQSQGCSVQLTQNGQVENREEIFTEFDKR